MFKQLLTVMAVAMCLVTCEAGCTNNCNGRGTCGPFDRCECHHAFSFSGAEDCSRRICPKGKSWGVAGSSTPHEYEECSGRGTCDRSTGMCECADGFTGHACQRTSCVNDCSGHGKCLTLSSVSSAYTGWDKYQMQTCECDAGYTSHDCSERMCPKGDDPLSLTVALGGSQVDEVQTCVLAGGATDLAGTFTVSFKDWRGQTHTTRALTLATVTALEVKEALMALPNNVIPSVTVAVTDPGSRSDGATLAITFTDATNSGPQNALTMNVGDHSTHGHSTIYKITGTTPTGTCTVTTTGTEESKVCAGRGVCDVEKGQCNCHTGFFGFACETQTSLQ